MYDIDDALKVLISKSTAQPEFEEDHDTDLMSTALKEYDFSNIIDSIGKDNFRELYLNAKSYILQYSIEDQINFCLNILKQIQEVYNFTFIFSYNILDKEDIEEVYDFLEKLEYDNIEFFSEVLKNLNFEVKSNIYNFLSKNFSEIEKKINITVISNKFFNEFIKNNSLENLLKYFIKNITKNRTLIYEELFRKENGLK